MADDIAIQAIPQPIPVSQAIAADLDAIAVPLGTKQVKFEADVADLPPGMALEIRIEVSDDAGETWRYEGSSTHDGTPGPTPAIMLCYDPAAGNISPKHMVRATRIVYDPSLKEPMFERTEKAVLVAPMTAKQYG